MKASEKYPSVQPCPMCGADDLHITDWCGDYGEFDAIRCGFCGCEAPAQAWLTQERLRLEREQLAKQKRGH